METASCRREPGDSTQSWQRRGNERADANPGAASPPIDGEGASDVGRAPAVSIASIYRALRLFRLEP
jgi:hypothetical protein